MYLRASVLKLEVAKNECRAECNEAYTLPVCYWQVPLTGASSPTLRFTYRYQLCCVLGAKHVLESAGPVACTYTARLCQGID